MSVDIGRRLAREAGRKTPIRLLVSPMTDTWYLVTRYTDLGGGRFIASTKQEVMPEDRANIEAGARQYREALEQIADWAAGSHEDCEIGYPDCPAIVARAALAETQQGTR